MNDVALYIAILFGALIIGLFVMVATGKIAHCGLLNFCCRF